MSRLGRFIGWFFLVFTITWYTQSSMATTLTGLNSKLEPNKFYNQSLTNLSKAVDLQEQNNQGRCTNFFLFLFFKIQLFIYLCYETFG